MTESVSADSAKEDQNKASDLNRCSNASPFLPSKSVKKYTPACQEGWSPRERFYGKRNVPSILFEKQKHTRYGWPDLADAYYEVVKCVKPVELRTKLRITTWQEVAQSAPPRLRAFLAVKYGIEGECNCELNSQAANYPGHNGTLPHDPQAPSLDEYGPFESQEARENSMVNRFQAEMANYKTGLFIIGVAHMHSLFSKLRAVGFEVAAYTWLS